MAFFVLNRCLPHPTPSPKKRGGAKKVSFYFLSYYEKQEVRVFTPLLVFRGGAGGGVNTD